MKEVIVPKLSEVAKREELKEESRAIAKDMWTGKLTPNEQKAVNQICRMYNLDPLLKQIVVLGGNLYISSGGLKTIAYRSKKEQPEAIVVLPASEQERKDYGCTHNDPNEKEYQHLFKAELYKKGSDRAFVEWGESDSSNVRLHNAGFKEHADMAKTRAVNRVIRNAYAISLTSIEEMGFTEGQIKNVTAEEVKSEEETALPEESKKITEAQRRLIFVKMKELNITEEMLKEFIKDSYNIESTKDILSSNMDDLLGWMVDMNSKE
jgi:hypothetical protein